VTLIPRANRKWSSWEIKVTDIVAESHLSFTATQQGATDKQLGGRQQDRKVSGT